MDNRFQSYENDTEYTLIETPALPSSHRSIAPGRSNLVRSPTGSTSSTSSSYFSVRGLQSDEGFESRRSSISSTTSRLTPAMTEYQYGYDLPCEFSFVGCSVRYSPGEYQTWIDHSASHCGWLYPSIADCTFCNQDFNYTRDNVSRKQNWILRMEHIARHFAEGRRLQTGGVEVNHPRPDFHVINHLWEHDLISTEDFRHATAHSERPKCEGLQSPGFVPPERLKSEERKAKQISNLEHEERHRKRGLKNGKGKTTHSSRTQNVDHLSKA